MGFNPLSGLKDIVGGVNVGGLLSGNPSIGGTFNKLKRQSIDVTKVDGELKSLYEPETAESLQYPMDLSDNHYLLFRIQKRIPKNDLVNNPQTVTSTKQTIALPIPANLRVDQSVNYNTTNLGIMGGMGAGATNMGELYKDFSQTINQFGGMAIDNIKENAGSLWDSVTEGGLGSAVTGVATTGLALGALSKLGIGAVSGAAAAAKLGQGLFFAQGKAFNPRMAVAFDNVNFREFQFSYRMIARNPEESEQITKIVKTFQTQMLPSYFGESRSGFNYPDEFIIEFADGIKEHLFAFNPCVLMNVGVTYNGESGPAFFDETNAPIIIDISLSFRETRINTREATVDEKFNTDAGSEQSRMLQEQEFQFSGTFGYDSGGA